MKGMKKIGVGKMKKINVYLQYPWGFSDSQYYRSLTENSPNGVSYISKIKKNKIITNKSKLFIFTFIKQNLRELIEKTNLPIINAKITKTKKSYDLIHCAHCLSLNNSPWVVDFESLWQAWISGRDTRLGRKKVLNLLISKNCKKIIVWTDTTKREFLKRFPILRNKITVLGYGQPMPKIKKIKHDGINLFFVSRFFNAKGGPEAIEVFDILTKKYPNVNATLISNVPKKVVSKYKNNNKITIYPNLINHEILMKEILPKMDILVYPGYSDSFGFIITEAMSFGIPVITVDGYGKRDIVRSGLDGFIVKKPKLMWKLKNAFSQIENTKKLMDNYPTDPLKINEWRELRNKSLGMNY